VEREPSPRFEVARLFLKLGLTAFGGPAAHIAMMRDEVVRRRQWLDDEKFLDLLGVANLIPGPSSTELAIFLGYLRAGPIGLLLGGVLFILPAMLLVLALAWAYVRFGSLPATGWLLYGIKPVVIGIVAHALWTLGRSGLKSIPAVGLSAAVLIAFLAGANPILLLLGSGVLVVVLRRMDRRWVRNTRSDLSVAPLAIPHATALAVKVGGGVAFSQGTLFLTFLKIGAVMFGGGYVLLAFVQRDFVQHLGWLSDQQVLDAVAVGQLTPGPLFSTATFIGYLTGGLTGAVIATVAIFLPSFIYVAIVFPWVAKLRESPLAGPFLDGVNAGALGLMAATTLALARAAVVDPFTACLALLAYIALARYRVNTAWLVLAGAVVGMSIKSVHIG
jgi:chromate transporter